MSAMVELTPYILTGFFALIGWYLRENNQQHGALVQEIKHLGATLSSLEQRLEDKLEAHVKRFDRFVLSQEQRLTVVETGCAIEHGKMPDRRILRRKPTTPTSWQTDSNIENGGTQT